MGKERSFDIVVFNSKINDSDFGPAEARELYMRKNLENIAKFLKLEENDFYSTDLESILDIINKYYDGFPIGIYEDGIIYDQEIKLKCLNELNNYAKLPQTKLKWLNNIFKGAGKLKPPNKFIYPIIDIFQFAIDRNKNIYFFF
jgi:hypothetical protein